MIQEQTGSQSLRGHVSVGAREVRSGGEGLAPFVLPECEALAAQQRWQDG